MTTEQFYEYKEAVLEYCPRGEEYFCDGTPNYSVEDILDAKKLGKCKYRQNGKCIIMERVYIGKITLRTVGTMVGEGFSFERGNTTAENS